MIDACPCPECGSQLEVTQRKRSKCPICGLPLYSLKSHGVFTSPYMSDKQRRVVQLANRIDVLEERLTQRLGDLVVRRRTTEVVGGAGP